jgi:hypothetical protein
MARGTHIKTKLAGFLAIFVTLAGAAAVQVEDAKASGRIGAYAPAEVVCDAQFGTMMLRPHFGASRSLTSQWLSFRYYILNIDTGRGYWTDWAQSFRHSAVYVTGAITEYRDWAYVPDWYYNPGPGRFQVWTNYAWYDGFWNTSIVVKTIGYDGVYFNGGGAYCRTTSVAG